MMTLLFFLAKAKSIIGALLTFILAHWQVFCIAAILALGTYKYNCAVKRAVKAETSLSALKQEIALQTKARAIENAIKAAQSKIAIQTAEKTAINQINKFKLNRTKLTNDVKAHYENRIDTINGNWNERVRIEQGKAATATRLPDQSITTERIARSESECNSALAELEILRPACRLTTIDFNTCRSVLNADTLACGRAN